MYDIPAADPLDTPVSDQDITTIAAMYLIQWEELSPSLGLTPQHESEIRHTFRDYSDQKREALRRWKRIKGHAATYHAFITAATAISNMELVDNVKAMLQTRERSTGNYHTFYLLMKYLPRCNTEQKVKISYVTCCGICHVFMTSALAIQL